MKVVKVVRIVKLVMTVMGNIMLFTIMMASLLRSGLGQGTYMLTPQPSLQD